MEKEKASSCSPDTVLEDFLRSAESETESSKASTSESEVQIDAQPASRWTNFFQMLRFKSKTQLATFHPLKLSKMLSSSMREEVGSVPNPLTDTNLNYFKPQWKNFSLSDLQSATSKFCHGNLIGKGGYAEVYRGCLRGGQLVAVKRFTKGSPAERIGDFLSELGIMAHVNHPNTAKLIGYGVEGGMHLVLELSPLGSLASVLQNCREKLKWDIRYKIALGTAKGLLYLHEGCQRRIVHRDIKAANILLAEDYEPLAKPLMKKNKIRELVDPLLAENYNPVQMNLMILAASLCVQQSSLKRPRMSQILLLLRGSCGSLDLIKKHRKLSSWKKYYRGLFSAEEYSFSRGLNGLNLPTSAARQV
ncbi:Receptor-like cytosolic serine/threonine-protein kinase RBK2 [Sesamum alatum]|uniref:Receptor-like cytosolic serine/threonine-protein kinase RBK2 n=1 Tax=Sesamum alatum TaxID=300844 RepID=A0AAE2D0Z8_9LAMI|nr:Receptor-like cytosolic serine/threonine-protein kinase RBK2 [Sesamum alatum]